MLGGILPFGACFVELFFILSSMWMDQYYYVFGFTLLVFVILLVTCAEVTVVLVYFQVQTDFYPISSCFTPTLCHWASTHRSCIDQR